MWKDIESEKRWFATKWARQEKEIRKIIDSTQGMYGDLQAVTGRSLTAIPALEFLQIYELTAAVKLSPRVTRFPLALHSILDTALCKVSAQEDERVRSNAIASASP